VVGVEQSWSKLLTVNRLTEHPEEVERAPKWQRRPDERRAEILDGAVLAFGRNGYKRATLAHVAEHAGVCPGTVSHYFGSKARLFEEMIAERLLPFVETEEASLASHQGSRCDQLVQVLRRLWDLAWQAGMLELMRVVKVESAEFPESGRLLCQQMGERWRRIFGVILTAGMQHGEFRQMDVDVAARTISYALFGVAEKVSAFRSYDARMPDREAMWQAIRDMVERFVLVTPARAHRQGEVV
jgi:AcrR family transcriptional regulator